MIKIHYNTTQVTTILLKSLQYYSKDLDKDSMQKEAFIKEIINQYADTIMRIAFQYVKNRADAEDITQEVFIKLIQKPIIADKEYLKAWIIRVTINKSKNFVRDCKRRQTVPLEKLENTLSKSQAEVFVQLDKLSQTNRNIIYMYYYEGYTAKEIGNILGKKEKAIMMRLSRARREIKLEMEENNENIRI